MTRNFTTGPAPHQPAQESVQTTMMQVLAALVPGIAASWWYFGAGIIVNITAALVAAVVVEAVIVCWRGQSAARSISDFSAVLTAVLLALALPPIAPIWLPALGAAIAIALGKQAFGGLGHNVFNPAMVGYAVLIVSFPTEMIRWTAPAGLPGAPSPGPGLGNILSFAWLGRLPDGVTIDSLTSATPLDRLREGLGQNLTVPEILTDPAFGQLGGYGWAVIGTAFAAGGAGLLLTRALRWQLPFAMLAGILLPALVMHLADPGRFPSPLFHLLTGATLLCAFFIVTDPVTAATSPAGRLVFGFGVGLLTWLIRTWGGYPDGVAFAILLMNAAAPTIDRLTRPSGFTGTHAG